MQKNLKQIFACAMVVIMTLTAVPLSGFVGLELPKWSEMFATKASALSSSGKCGENVTYTYNSSTGEVVISGTGAMYYYGYNYDYDYGYDYGYGSDGFSPFYSSNIKSVIVREGVTTIGDGAFSYCSDLTNVMLPNSVTTIGDGAFSYCSSLTSVTIPDSVTTIGDDAFRDTAWYNDQPNGDVYAGKVYYKYKGTMPKNTSIVIKDDTKGISDHAFSLCTGLTSVEIPNSVTRIGDDAFIRCSGLTSITIPDSVTSIGSHALYYCTGLTSVTIGNSVTSIGYSAFGGCTGLTSISIPNSVTSIGEYEFEKCTGLTSVTIGNNVISISNRAFYNCTSLTSVTIGNSVTSIGNRAFYNCTSLTSITIPDSVTSIDDYAFYDCTGLTSVTIGNSVISIGNRAFYNCTSLTSITIPDSVASIGNYAFGWCTGLTRINWNAESVSDFLSSSYAFSNAGTAGEGIDVVFGDNVKSIPTYAFYDCTSLTSVTIGNSVTSIGDYAFKYCTGLTRINWNAESVSDFSSDSDVFFKAGTVGEGIDIVFGDNVKSIPAYAFNCDYNSRKPNIKSVTIGNSVTSIGDKAFYNCTCLTSVPDSIESMGKDVFQGTAWYDSQPYGDVYAGKVYYKYKGTMLENTSIVFKEGTKGIAGSAFADRIELTSITIPDSVTSVGDEAFSCCSNLTRVNILDLESWCKITFGDFNANPLYYANKLYINGNLATNIAIPSSITSLGDYVFAGCTSLTDVTIHDGVTSIGDGALSGCTGLTNVTIPDSVTYIGWNAFSNCTDLTSITIPDSVTSISNFAFDNCTCLTNVTIPDSVTSIGHWSFGNCTALRSVTIPESIRTIGCYAFTGCANLTSISIPNSVTSIGDYAFENCTSITKINWNAESVSDFSSVSYVFYNVGTAENGIEVEFGDNVKTIPDYAFSGCTKLIMLAIGNSVTSIGDHAFYDTSIKNVIIPDSVNSLGSGAFGSCDSLTNITIGNGIETIPECTFNYCNKLTTIKIGKNLKEIKANAFSTMVSFPDIYFAGSEDDWKNVSIDNSNEFILRATMYYNADITHEHAFVSTITKQPTCTENGVKTFVCDCGKTYTESISATGHTPSDWIVDFEVTCTTGGSKHKECTICKTVLETEELTATGHNYKNEITASTCTSIGYETKTCLNCGECQFIRSIPATGHTSGEWIIDSEATCTNVGSKHKECSVCKEKLETAIIPTTAHNLKTETTDATCTSIGYVTKICQNCGECQFVKGIPEKGHSVKTVSVPANFTESGLSITSCKTCGTITKATLIKRIASVSLAKTAYVYNGKVQTPSVVVKDSAGKMLKNGTDYTVKYSSGRKNPGQYTVTVTFKGNYSGTKTLSFTIAPKAPTLKVTAGTKKAILSWNKQTGATGYVVYMATSKNGKYSKVATVKGNSKTSYTKTGLTKGKTYYFKVRAYMTVDGKNIYGDYSSVKSVKIK